ncbi:MAG: hypothetical protein KF836_03840 [Fimbriimonadaceae bacterium]|nr:hypothetical protein [Fimbriimonadaceae bacterium]
MKHHGLLDLNEAIQNPGVKLSFEVQTELPEEEDLDLIEPITGSIEAVSTGNALLINAKFKTKCVVECARCGEPLEKELAFEMEDDFAVEGVPSCYGSDGYAEVVCDEPYPLFKGNNLNPDLYSRQGLFVSMPDQPLCQFGWDGPCPNAAITEKLKDGGHPGMQILEQFRSEDNA